MARKPELPDQPGRHQMNVRTTAELRKRMVDVAQQNGRTLAQEVEHRLEKSFERDVVFQLLMGGVKNSRLIQKLTMLVARTEGDWEQRPGEVAGLKSKLGEAVDEEVELRKKDAAGNASPTN